MDNRPDPDQLLKSIEPENSRRGKLKIFFGATAGVGKTYTMLEQARQRKKEGIDVVVGIVETHKRKETEALLEGLEVLPLKTISYRGVELQEFDLETALKRRPTLLLVDELAHTNAPESRHAKRWHDVEELLDAGINVYTTLNVQHCESANDVVAQITKVLVKETVPDTFIEKSDQIELVDIPPEELLKRLAEGKVYLGPQADLAAGNFFRLGNLIALRQLALRYTTRSVDTRMRAYKDVHAIPGVWKVGEHFLVGISANPGAVKIIRAAKQVASDLGASWVVACVERPSAVDERPQDKARIAEMLRFAETLGAQTVVLSGDDVALALIDYARSRNISKIIVGKPGKPRLSELLFGTFIDKLAHKCGDIDLYLISGQIEGQAPASHRPVAISFPWRSLLWAAAMIGLCTVINALLFEHLALANLIMVYLLGVAWLAFRYGRRISLVGTFLSVVCFDFFFVPPYYSFTVMDKEHVITFAVMVVVGWLIGSLTGRLRRQTISLQQREEKTQVLYSLSRDLAALSRPDELLQTLVSHVQSFFKSPAVIFVENRANKTLSVLTAVSDGRDLAANEHAVAAWVHEHRKPAGKGTDTLSASQGMYVPLVGSRDVVGVLGVFPADERQFHDPENLHILELFVKQTALAVEGAWMAEASLRSEAQMERVRLSNMLFDTFSHDFRNSLEAISKSASALLNAGTTADVAKRDDLVREIIRHADQLNSLTSELPNVVRDPK
jgi:two-component system sensor histidine kinase KdpD